MKATFQAKVDATGNLRIINRQSFDKELLNHLDKDVIITIERKVKKRSLSQNSYYWKVVVLMITQGLNDSGYRIDKDTTHEFLKMKFGKKDIVNDQTGEVIGQYASTANMNTSEMLDYIAEIQQFAIEFLNVYIPDPNEQLKVEI